MKKFLSWASLVALTAIAFSSCTCDKTVIGNISPDEELVHVATVNNHHFVGLLVSHEDSKNYVPGVKNFVIENKTTFWGGVVSCVTFGLYSPTVTKYYVPKSNSKAVSVEKKFYSKAYKGYLKK